MSPSQTVNPLPAVLGVFATLTRLTHSTQCGWGILLPLSSKMSIADNLQRWCGRQEQHKWHIKSIKAVSDVSGKLWLNPFRKKLCKLQCQVLVSFTMLKCPMDHEFWARIRLFVLLHPQRAPSNQKSTVLVTQPCDRKVSSPVCYQPQPAGPQLTEERSPGRKLLQNPKLLTELHQF